MSLRKIFIFLMPFVLLGSLSAQTNLPDNWYLLNPDKSDYFGIQLEETYEVLLKEKPSKEVIVAIIDSGVDIDHEDLDGNIWTNADEIPGNGEDDDGNGYVDDRHGWNFIGGPGGKNVYRDNLEVTRLLRKYEQKYGKVDHPTELPANKKKEYAYYLTLKKEVTKKRNRALRQLERYNSMKDRLISSIDDIEQALNGKEFTLENIKQVETSDSRMMQSKQILAGLMSQLPGDISSADDLRHTVNRELDHAIDHFDTKANYQYNPDFDPRSIVGDDYENPKQRIYGNNDVDGPHSFHGTHVAGIIGAERDNEIGMDGILKNVRLMPVRAVPDGDERDKDVANAIRYAVDNGASVINMSFGKGYSWNKKIVDKAVKYAARHDVLLVHAAGNGSSNNDSTTNYPNDRMKHGWIFSPDVAPNWIEVGASGWEYGEQLATSFSNYGSEQVDLFAPGLEIYSTTPNDQYQRSQGTSMAAPVVSGVAALIRSYFPELSALEVKDILMNSVSPLDLQVKKPGSDELVPFQSLSVSGGVVNAWSAVLQAMRESGKYQETFQMIQNKKMSEERATP